jgi:mRNA-degrading endonuclease RelE of RelBE toxin-antitoxin system
VAYAISFSKAVRAQIQHLPGSVKAIAKQQMAALSENPRPPQAKELTGHPNYYRLWLGATYRLVWHIVDDRQLVEIEYVGPKTPDLYTYLGLSRPSNLSDE